MIDLDDDPVIDRLIDDAIQGAEKWNREHGHRPPESVIVRELAVALHDGALPLLPFDPGMAVRQATFMGHLAAMATCEAMRVESYRRARQ